MSEIRFRSVTPTELGHDYWEAAEGGVLRLSACQDCGRARLYLTTVCAVCHSRSSAPVAASGRGVVYASTVVRYRLSPEFASSYVLALVDLDEGVRMMANILVPGEPGVVPIGTEVRLVFEQLPSGHRLPQFQVVETPSALD